MKLEVVLPTPSLFSVLLRLYMCGRSDQWRERAGPLSLLAEQAHQLWSILGGKCGAWDA